MKTRKKLPIVIIFLNILLITCAVYFANKAIKLNNEYKQAKDYYVNLLEYKPEDNNDKGENQTDSFTELLKNYKDIIGWISIENTTIDYPFVQYTDNDYYVRRAIDKTYLIAGTLFLDYRCQKDLTSNNSIIYGHNMNSGGMFTDIVTYKNKEVFDNSNIGRIVLLDEVYSFNIFAYIEVLSNDEIIYNPNISINEDLLEYIQAKSIHYAQPEYDENTQFITLSTCAKINSEERSVIIGVLNKL